MANRPLGEVELRSFLQGEMQSAKKAHAQALQDRDRAKAAAEKAAAQEKQAQERLRFFESQLEALAPGTATTATRGHGAPPTAKAS